MSDGDICPACGSTNNCGMEKGEASCWCFGMPHVLPVSATEDDGRTGERRSGWGIPVE